MSGLNYALGLYAPGGTPPGRNVLDGTPVYLVVQPKLFADMGGAGVTYIGDVPIVRILRGAGAFTSGQLEQRHAFQSEFVTFVRRRLQTRPGVRWLPGPLESGFPVAPAARDLNPPEAACRG